MKELANFLLCRKPLLYQKLLKFRRTYNFEKILFLSLIKDGDVVFDIGANRGYYTLLYSHIVGRSGEVHAFEPVPTTFKNLSQQIAAKKRFENIYLKNAAISDREGTITLYMPDDDDGQASAMIHNSGSWDQVKNITNYTCNALRIDDYVACHSIKHLDFIKLDIEGAELLALRGAAYTLSQYAPIVYLEIFQDWLKTFNYNSSDTIEFLSGLGYSNFYLVNNTIKALVNPQKELASENFSTSVNLLCTKTSIHSYIIKTLFKV